MNPSSLQIVPAEGKANALDISSGLLYPILPSTAGRYDVVKRVQCSHATVEAGMYMAARTPLPQYLPHNWSTYTHPEGKTYFCRNTQLRVVTDSYLYDRETSDKVMAWISLIEKMAAAQSFVFAENIELYVQLEGGDCNYYFADHTARALFWLEAYQTSDLGLLSVVSTSHLKLQLEEQYWTHLEYFCMHPLQLDSNIIEETISILTHGCGDHLTSGSSTFPYNTQECKQFLKLLIPCRDQIHDGKVITLAARLNTVITANRYWTHYGQEQPRLSRTTSILEDYGSELVWTQSASSALSLGASAFFNSRFKDMFADSYVYEQDWRKLMTTSVKKWKRAFFMSLGLLFLHSSLFYLPASQTLGFLSAGCLILSILSASLLIHRFEDQEEGTAGEAHEYLTKNRLPKVGFQGVAVLFALPQAFNLWGLLLLFSQTFTLVDTTYLTYAVATSVVSLVAFRVLKSLSRGASRFFARTSKKSDNSVV